VSQAARDPRGPPADHRQQGFGGGSTTNLQPGQRPAVVLGARGEVADRTRLGEARFSHRASTRRGVVAERVSEAQYLAAEAVFELDPAGSRIAPHERGWIDVRGKVQASV
jgi:hypothetical protein